MGKDLPHVQIVFAPRREIISCFAGSICFGVCSANILRVEICPSEFRAVRQSKSRTDLRVQAGRAEQAAARVRALWMSSK